MSAALVVQCVQAKSAAQQQEQAKPAAARETAVELAFYRKYTEGMLRRYMYRSMEIGRVPALLGDFCEGTGGKLFVVEDLNDLPDMAEKISASLRNQPRT